MKNRLNEIKGEHLFDALSSMNALFSTNANDDNVFTFVAQVLNVSDGAFDAFAAAGELSGQLSTDQIKSYELFKALKPCLAVIADQASNYTVDDMFNIEMALLSVLDVHDVHEFDSWKRNHSDGIERLLELIDDSNVQPKLQQFFERVSQHPLFNEYAPGMQLLNQIFSTTDSESLMGDSLRAVFGVAQLLSAGKLTAGRLMSITNQTELAQTLSVLSKDNRFVQSVEDLIDQQFNALTEKIKLEMGEARLQCPNFEDCLLMTADSFESLKNDIETLFLNFESSHRFNGLISLNEHLKRKKRVIGALKQVKYLAQARKFTGRG